MAIGTLQTKLKFTGAYKCPHLGLQHVPERSGTTSRCCAGAVSPQDQFVPICTLANGLCPGLVSCPRLDIKTKGELIQQWRQDLNANKPVDIEHLMK